MSQMHLYYSVQNGGDGSAYPQLFESLALCDIDQDFQDEGWAETCSGSFIVESDTPITIISEVTTGEEVLEEIEELREYAESAEARGRFDDKQVAVQEYISERDHM